MYMHMSVCDSNELFEHVEFAKLESSNSHITAQPEQTCEVVTLSSPDDRILGIGSTC